jgi:hypothetical protein
MSHTTEENPSDSFFSTEMLSGPDVNGLGG